ncbi:hypothetical protein Cgig2_007944 [Carnegiea gigantea]|uniref:DYW domain-containing protein n=1 Tax=Carnegiea gigantea TaxID=171969 RepID=A0A9Q1KDG3_9CARY|nr:hypothetical protein Cgig2_007944 [Carnegiea gigantea]
MSIFSLLPPAKFPLSSAKPSESCLSKHPHPPAQSIKFPTFETLNSRLIYQANAGHLYKAISTLDLMSHYGFAPDLTTLSLLLKSSIRSHNYELGKLVHSRLCELGLELDSVLLNSLISLYSKCGEWRKAAEIFEMMGEKRNLVSWSAMISCFANNGMESKAIETFVEMLGLGFYPNEFCFPAVIRACSNSEWAWIGEIINGFTLKTGHCDDLCVGSALVDMYVKGFEDLGSAQKVFDTMPERNVVVWTLMITRFVQMGFPEKAIELFLEMERSGCEPDRFTFTSVVSACSELELLALGKQLHSRAVRSGLTTDSSVGCGLIEMYAKCAAPDSLACSRKVFGQITGHNVLSWTSIIAACAQSEGYEKEALELYINMIEGPVQPNDFTLASVLKACAALCDPLIGGQVHCHAVKLGLAWDDFVGNSVISMYSQTRRVEQARKAFDLLSEKNLVSYNTLLDGYARNLDPNAAFELVHELENTEREVDAFTFTSLLGAAASICSVSKGEQIHGRIMRMGFKSNLHIWNALISMYSRCGNIEAAYKVFSEMGDQTIVSWTSMITGFAKHGFASKALNMFDQMIKAGVKPNEVTFVAVLLACSHVGMVSEGKKHFDSMFKEYGLVPRMEHYACMVDLLGRSGFLVEALEFINSMPIMANSLVWRTLLGASLLHGDTEIGEHAAKMVIKQDPNDPASYTLLSNLYASEGQWENVQKIRTDMKDKNLRKEAGCSWIESNNRVHKFLVGDTSHARAPEIYEKLDEVICEIREMGYVPNTDFVLHDLEEEQKEPYLLQHSEKLAVAYGLTSTPRSKPIRVFKNLRICGDCHTAMKYISKATGREIIVRDSNRQLNIDLTELI